MLQIKRSALLPVVGFSTAYALKQLQDTGLDLTQRPSHDPPEMPYDISGISFKEVGFYQGAFKAWAGYMRAVVAQAESRATESKVIKERAYAIARLQKAGTVQDKDAKVLTDDQYAAVENRYLQDSAKAKLLKAKMEEFQEYADVLSREQTRRETELKSGERY